MDVEDGGIVDYCFMGFVSGLFMASTFINF